MMSDLADQGWFEREKAGDNHEVWDLTREAFNFMWPKNTPGPEFDVSLQMVKLRVDQILDTLPGKHSAISGKRILDSGCGPGRYIRTLLDYDPSEVVGLDFGVDIIEENKKRFSEFSNVKFTQSSCHDLPFDNEYFDFVVSAGVLHHLENPMESLIKEHARVIRKGGYLFIFIAGKGGLELEVWRFMRKFLNSYPIEHLFSIFDGVISPLRLQGLLDHSYGEYQQNSREDVETWLGHWFTRVDRVRGVEGLDVTPEIFEDDIYFDYRFGSGNLRNLCQK
jgi:ubiquinone/menaquinone biosynthesis C-methylase UbiE